LDPVVEGELQPVGTTSVTEPLEMPPVAAVYVKVIVFPVELRTTVVVGVVNVPEPSAAFTVTLGDELRFVRLPPAVDFSCACHVCAPVLDVAAAPGPPPAVEPYVIVAVAPPASVSDESVIVWLATDNVPEVDVE
jgi:hypothetical protein